MIHVCNATRWLKNDGLALGRHSSDYQRVLGSDGVFAALKQLTPLSARLLYLHARNDEL